MGKHIGYDPDALMIHMKHKQEIGDLVIGNESQKLRDELKTMSEKVIFEKTGIKIGCSAQVCLSNGLSLVDGLRPMHDHDDSHQHVLVKVTAIDYWGEIAYIDESGVEGSTYMGMITLCDDAS